MYLYSSFTQQMSFKDLLCARGPTRFCARGEKGLWEETENKPDKVKDSEN